MADGAARREADHERMKISASVERRIEAPADAVYAVIADFREHHPRILPSAFSDLAVEEGGVGAGTVHRFTLTLGGRARTSRARIDEPEPGRVLTEREIDGNLVTTFTVDALPHERSHVTIATTWETPGMRGVMERIAAPRILRRLYTDELTLLDRYVRRRSKTAPRVHRANRAFVIA